MIGTSKFSYDLWGDTVNTASRMESQGKAGETQVTESTYERIRHAFICQPLGTAEVEGKGLMNVWQVLHETVVSERTSKGACVSLSR